MSSTDAPEIEIFIFFGIIIGTMFTYIISRVLNLHVIPYTVVIFITGILLSLLATKLTSHGSKHVDTLILSITAWENINPYLFLYIFLPVLLFGESMTLNPHHVIKTFFPALLLALPGAAFGAYIIGIGCQYLLSYDWPWVLCFLVGAVLSSTDPVSVIALLKQEVNTSVSLTRLTYLIIGESMLNDASSLVLFDLLSANNRGNIATNYIIFYIKVIFISPVIGIAIGLGGVFLLRKFNLRVSDEDSISQIALTVSTAYVSFFLGQYVLAVSGIVSCCAAGLVFAWIAPPLILRPHSMNIVWHFLVWIGETLVFIISGLLVGKLIVNYVEAKDLGSIFIVYVIMSLSRIVVVVLCFPIIKWMMPVYSLKDSIFVAFSGIRGTTSLALILVLSGLIINSRTVLSDTVTFDALDVHRATFIASSVVAITIAVNGALSGQVLKSLGIKQTNITDDDKVINHYVFKRIVVGTKRIFRVLERSLAPIDSDFVQDLCSILHRHRDSHVIDNKGNNDNNDNESAINIDIGNSNGDSNNNSNNDNNRVSHNLLMNPISQRASKISLVSSDIENGMENEVENNDEKQQNDQQHEKRIESGIKLSSSIHLLNPMEEYKRYGNMMESSIDNLFSQKAYTYETISRRKASLYLDSSSLRGEYQRNIQSEINPELLTRTRNIFLEILRKSYGKQIVSGNLPRGCNAALILLASIDTALETTNTGGLQDWDSVFSSLSSMQWLCHIADYLTTGSLNKWIKEVVETDRVICLTSYIEAHKYAQTKLCAYLGEEDRIDTPEEDLVIRESASNINQAVELLVNMDEEQIIFLKSKIAARMVLHKEEDMIIHFVEEGILGLNDAEILLQSAHKDMVFIDRCRHRNMTSTRRSIELPIV